MSLQDETGTVLKNAVCYHNQCGALFGGDEVVSTLCKASSDLVVRKKLDALIKAETVITATIKHQGVTCKFISTDQMLQNVNTRKL